VDWYHAEERLWDVGKEGYGQGKERARKRVEGGLTQLRDGDLSGVRRQIRGLKSRHSESKEVVRQALVYFTNQAHRLQNPLYRERRRYPIGRDSGESACPVEYIRLYLVDGRLSIQRDFLRHLIHKLSVDPCGGQALVPQEALHEGDGSAAHQIVQRY